MPNVPGDLNIARLFGFPGFEAFIRVSLKYVNLLRVEQGDSALVYEEFRAEIEAQAEEIINPT